MAHAHHQHVRNPNNQWGPMGPRNLKPRLVWPRDKNQGTWARLKDIFSGKGPDIWLSKDELGGPTRPVWSGWKSPEAHMGNPNVPYWDNLGYAYRRDNIKQPVRGAERAPGVKYDFRTRRYKYPDINTWTDVKHSRRDNRTLYHRDIWGWSHVDPRYDHGENARNPWRNAFAYDPRNPFWPWHERPNWRNEVPLWP